jgi:chromate transporter
LRDELQRPALDGAGLVPLAWQQRHRFSGEVALLAHPFVAQTEAVRDVGLGRLFLVFLEVGALLYGSGYVLLAFLERNLVHELGWLTEWIDVITRTGGRVVGVCGMLTACP